MFDFELMKKLRENGCTTKEAANKLGVSLTTLNRKGWSKLPFNSLSICKYKKDLNYFKNIDTFDKAYILGFLIADGTITNKGVIAFELADKDIEILNYIKKQISPDSIVKKYDRKRSFKDYTWDSNTSILYIKSKNYYTDLEKLGVLPNKTYLKQSIPNIDLSLMPHFIRGYFDGDGSVWESRGHLRISFTGEFNFLSELSNFLYENKVLSKHCTVIQKRTQHDAYFAFGAEVDKKSFFNFIYNKAPFFLTRKFKKFNYKLV